MVCVRCPHPDLGGTMFGVTQTPLVPRGPVLLIDYSISRNPYAVALQQMDLRLYLDINKIT